jgi:hypothetical protein
MMANQRSNRIANRAARQPNREERGVALFFSIFALLLLSAIAATLILSSATDTAINWNYRSEEVAYFGAKSGVEEVRDRMITTNPNGNLPATGFLPTTPTSPMLYVMNEGTNGGTVQPWNLTISGKPNPYADDELCHDGYSPVGIFAGMSSVGSVASDQRCTTLPTGGGWYVQTTSTAPWNGTTAALPYKWARVGLKLDASVQNYVNDGTAVGSSTSGNLVCWNGTAEEVLPVGQVETVTSCSTAFSSPANPVYLITALGIAPNGARKMVQAEVALTPTTPFIYGLFATSTACPAVSFTGTNASTNSYTTAGGGTYGGANSTTVSWGGDVGSNGGVSVQNGNIGGIVGVLPASCATPFSIGSNGADLGPNCTVASPTCVACAGPTGPLCLANTQTNLTTPVTFPTPPAPNPATPNTSYNGGNSLVPGTYGNISITGSKTLTLAPGVYNINSISMTGNGQINVSPPGAVTINIGGTGQASPLAIAGNGITDDTIPNDFVINYAGTGSVSVAGNGSVWAMLDAPNATVSQTGNGAWYGSIVASTISIGGNAFFHFDRNAALSPLNNGFYSMLSYRELSY